MPAVDDDGAFRRKQFVEDQHHLSWVEAVVRCRGRRQWLRGHSVPDIGTLPADPVRQSGRVPEPDQLLGGEPCVTVDADLHRSGTAERGEVDVRLDKLEHVTLEPEAYDFAYCCQTLEHADSPAGMIASMHAALKTGGTLFIEVPNLEVISYPLTIEEFFIDKHTAHFSHRLLCAYVEWSGFRLEEGTNSAEDILNVRILATKVGPAKRSCRTASSGSAAPAACTVTSAATISRPGSAASQPSGSAASLAA